MNHGDGRGDLLVLVADLDMEQAVKGLLARPESLEMAPVKFEIRRHPRRDSGCRTGAVEYLRAFLGSYRHALILFDLEGSGSDRAREEARREVEAVLSRSGRDGRMFAEIPEIIAGRLNIRNHIGVHGRTSAPRQRALV